MSDDTDEILDGLRPLFAEAREKGLWFYTAYQGIRFSPDELAREQVNGKFLWGAVNWRLRDPADRLHELAMARDDASKTFAAFAKKYSDFINAREKNGA